MKLILAIALLIVSGQGGGVEEMKQLLCGVGQKRWILDEQLLGHKPCNAPDLTFERATHTFTAAACDYNGPKKGQWAIEIDADDEYHLILQGPGVQGQGRTSYYLEIYNQEKESGGKQVLRLRTKGTNLRDQTIDLIYYASQTTH